MGKTLLVAGLCCAAMGCGGGLSKEQAAQQVDQMLVLFKENKPKFVEQKQQLIQADSCDRATALKQAVNEKVQAAAMSPERDEALTMVNMELEQAERDCLAK